MAGSVFDAVPWGTARRGTEAPAGLERYRSSEAPEQGPETEIEKAAKLESMAEALLDWDREVPAEAASWKMYCPWDFEHLDDKLVPSKTARYYGAANAVMCFKMHGWITPVRLRARQWKMTQRQAAQKILRAHGQAAGGWYRQRWFDLQAAAEQREEQRPDPQYAVAALHVALSAVPGYAVRQYDEDVRAILESAMEELVDGVGVDAMREWIDRTVSRIQACI